MRRFFAWLIDRLNPNAKVNASLATEWRIITNSGDHWAAHSAPALIEKELKMTLKAQILAHAVSLGMIWAKVEGLVIPDHAELLGQQDSRLAALEARMARLEDEVGLDDLAAAAVQPEVITAVTEPNQAQDAASAASEGHGVTT
jgi:hypothetical protein